MEKTCQFAPGSGEITKSALFIEKLHNCEDCPIRLMASRQPRSVFARLHIWHTSWWPGWKAYLARVRSFSGDTGFGSAK